MRSFVTAHIDLNRIRENAADIRRRTRVEVLAVVKSDAYSLGAERLVEALCDVVDGFCVFVLKEAVDAGIYRRTGKKTLCLGPPESMNPDDYHRQLITPAVSDREHAILLKSAHPALCVDTGMQRFACVADQVEATLNAGDIHEAFTHGTKPEHATKLKEVVSNRVSRLHAAGSALLDEPSAWFSAVRPGMALYEGAIRLTTSLAEVHDATGPAGYSGFVAPRFGVILMGYSHGLRPGSVMINGELRRILEIGMQSAFVEAATSDRTGDRVELINDTLTPQAIAQDWKTSPQEVLVTLCKTARRDYID